MSMHTGWLKFVLAIHLTLASAAVAAAPPLNIYVGQGQMPFADEQSGDHGLFGELMQVMCQRLQRDCHFMVVPWKRAQVDIARDPQGIMLNLGRIPEREDNFLWLLNVLPVNYVLASQEQTYDSLAAALDAGPVAVMGGTPRAQQLQAMKRAGQSLVEVTDPKQAARMLHGGRVSAWYEIDARIHYLWNELEYSPARLRFSPSLGTSHTYIAGSPILADATHLQQQMRQIYSDMRDDGSWERILGRYLDESLVRKLLQHP